MPYMCGRGIEKYYKGKNKTKDKTRITLMILQQRTDQEFPFLSLASQIIWFISSRLMEFTFTDYVLPPEKVMF